MKWDSYDRYGVLKPLTARVHEIHCSCTNGVHVPAVDPRGNQTIWKPLMECYVN